MSGEVTGVSLVSVLSDRGGAWQAVFDAEKLLIAVNQEMASWEDEINDGDEVAFFPPVTGG